MANGLHVLFRVPVTEFMSALSRLILDIVGYALQVPPLIEDCPGHEL